ncbi:alpha-mannosidase 2x-like [Mya arenaria]|uniref:alpha-mannosidase 2x-like n=1 Tax=Mya arenaria TaxID=6604 RepID=UPI0022E78E43|nr:alpha-mannosidase 2x-like [Mya arenaria]
MKKYMAVWGALFFCVVCLSLYLMLETLNTSPGRYTDIDAESLAHFEQKVSDIQEDIKRNQIVIDQIKAAVKDIPKDDNQNIEKLQDLIDKQNAKLKFHKNKVIEMQQKPKQPVDVEKYVPATLKEIQLQNPPGKIPATGEEAFVSLRKPVPASKEMCSWVQTPSKKPDIQIEDVVKDLPFDNPDGGAWKQGWNVTYPAAKWNQGNKLRVFVVPHSHNDPGWVKTYDKYYTEQVRHILNNMLEKLEQHPKMKFMYAEISFFHIWWNELDESKKNRVRRLFEDGRLEIVTGGWVMNDEANTHYFAMLDQLLEGHQWLDGTLGVKPSSGWAIDPFGHTPTMAYLLRRSGFNSMLIQRVHYALKKHLAKNKQLEFMWRQNWDKEGNTDMLCHMMPFYSYDIPHTCGPEPAVCCQFDFRRLPGSSYSCPWHAAPKPITDSNVAERARLIIDQWKKKGSLYKSNSVFAPLGDDFRYDKADEWDLQYVNYQKIFDYLQQHPELGVEAQFGTLSDYFKSIYEESKVKPGEKPTDFPTLVGDFFTYADKDDHYWSGYFTSRPFQKNLDRVMESHLRAAEIIFSMALTVSRQQKALNNFPATVMMDRLIQARRNLGLFQHHDGITGTAKDFVVVDYGNRLLKSLEDTKHVIKDCATYLSLAGKENFRMGSNEQPALFDIDETREAHDALPVPKVIDVGEEGDDSRLVLLYNSLAHERDQVVSIHVSSPHVMVQDENNKPVLAQVAPVWEKDDIIAENVYKVSFRVTIPGLAISKYMVKRVAETSNSNTIPVSILVLNVQSDAPIERAPFSIQKTEARDFTLENPYMKATFRGANGLLNTVVTKEDGSIRSTKLDFVMYGTKNHNGDRSGAYLFLPDGSSRPLPDHTPPVIHVVKGPVVSEVQVYFNLVTHVVRLYNSSGVDGISLDIQNIVDIQSQRNMEVAVRITTDVENAEREFYTDLNGFHMQKHRYYDKLTLQGNFYPMPTMAFIEDSKHRVTVLSANSLGFANTQPGVMEVMLDRRLNQDDSRGLGQGVTDSKQTPSRFKLLFETRASGAYSPTNPLAFPSLLAHHTSLQLIHPVFTIPANTGHHSKYPQFSAFSPLATQLPCDTHMVNLRTNQNADDGKDRLVPKHSAALFLHRLGYDCNFVNKGLACSEGSGEVVLSNMFRNMQITVAQQVSLTLMYHEADLDTTGSIDLDPMEIGSYVVTLQ